MEFLPGGDLMTMLIKYDTFSEDVTRFYMAECVLAIEAVHNLGFIHRWASKHIPSSHPNAPLKLRDIKPDNILIDKDGHIKLSDFGLSTGFHKNHDSSYYQRLLDQANGATSPTTAAQSARNSVMVNSINLTMTSKDQIATWKANRRKLVRHSGRSLLHKGSRIYLRRTQQSERQITLHPKSSCNKGTAVSATGGRWAQSCLSALSATHRFVPRQPTKHTKKLFTGRIIL